MLKSQNPWFRSKLGLIGIVAIFGILLIANGCSTLATPPAEEAEEAGVAADAPAEAAESDSEADVEESEAAETPTETYNGIPVGYTEEGYVFRGNPDAPITMYEYSDYQCPFCQRYFSQTEPALNEAYVQSGQVKVVFMDFPLEQLHPNAPQAHAAATCVAEQSPVAFWQMHALLFETRDAWSSQATSNPVTHFIELAQQIDDMDVLDFENCLASGRTEATVEATYNTARELGFSGTPSFQFVVEESGESYELVGAQPFDRFSSWIDAMVAGEAPADAAADSGGGGEGSGEIPFWATAEGLALDPDKPGFTVAGDHSRGSIDAKVVVIEYSDFQCPFCQRHTTQTQPILDEKFVDTGLVRWVFKHFPLNIHPYAPAAGVAAECAAEQGQFWEMHDLLFKNVSAWSISEPNPIFEGLAAELDLDADAYATCLLDEEMMQRVQSDFAEGRQFVQGTPTFIVMFGEQGRIIPGALPAESFVEALQGVLDAAQ